MLNYTPNTKTKSQKQKEKNVRQYAWQPTYRLACASHAPASAAQAAYCAPQRHLPSFATERKLVRAQAATRARATPPAPQIRSAAAKHTTTTPSSRHECPCALLNTRWRVMRRGTDAPPLLRAPAAQSRQVRLWRKRPTPRCWTFAPKPYLSRLSGRSTQQRRRVGAAPHDAPPSVKEGAGTFMTGRWGGCGMLGSGAADLRGWRRGAGAGGRLGANQLALSCEAR